MKNKLQGESMEIKNKIDNLLKNQKDIIKQYEDIISELNLDEPINENISLRKEVERYKIIIEELKFEKEKLLEENIGLKISLKEQMINEKIAILNASKNKIDMYFNDSEMKDLNKLGILETLAKGKLNKIKIITEKELIEEKEVIFSKVQGLEQELNQRIKIRKEKLNKEKENIIYEMKKEYDELKKEGITEEVLNKKRKYNDIEVKIGLNWINKIGIMMLLLAMATVMKYTYSEWFNDYMKGISGLALGGFLLGIGEWMNRKNKNIFALGMSGGGIGILYLSVFSSYFILKIINMQISILLSILITVLSLTLSQRYKSMTICGISLIGGYLPFFSYVFFEGISGTQIYIAMLYLIVLNLLVLGIGLKRRWIYINYLSFILNVPCFIYLGYESSNQIVGICYGITTFIMYLLITLIYPIKEKVSLKKVDIILLGLNTVINCLFVYDLFEIAEFDEYKGILAFIYALVYFILAEFIKKRASQEKSTQILFYITAMTFSVLMIPIQFGMKWALLGWLIESILIIYYTVKTNDEKMEIGGWVILGLCILEFIMEDFIGYWGNDYFTLKYTLITISIIYIFTIYAKKLSDKELFKYTNKGKLLTYYKYFTIINTWIYLIRITETYYKYIQIQNNKEFYFMILVSMITAGFAYGISKIKIIQDKVVKTTYICQYIIVDIIGFGMNFSNIEQSSDKAVPIMILILYNILVFFSIKELILKFIKEKGFSLEIYPIAMALYVLGSSTALIINQLNLSNINLTMSILFIAMSFIYIIYGFRKRFVILRRFGLGLSIFSTGKLFIFDLAFLDTLGKIAAYFCFGIVLMGISYIYHKLTRSAEEGRAYK